MVHLGDNEGAFSCYRGNDYCNLTKTKVNIYHQKFHHFYYFTGVLNCVNTVAK